MKKIIIIDDIKTVLAKSNSFLDRSAIDVFPVPTNLDALHKLVEVKADLIISYLDMPDMNGEQLCTRLRKPPFSSSVAVMMVCPQGVSPEDASSRCGADAFISPPFKADDLLRKAYDLLKIPARTSFRVPVNTSTSLQSGDGERFLGFSQDLSATGMLLGTTRVISMGDVINCSFALSETEQIDLKAEVIRLVGRKSNAMPHLYGLKFIDVSPAQAVQIDCFIFDATQDT